MARERTADDQVIALLARTALPLERSQIAETLGWAREMADKVLRRLAQIGRVEVTPGVSTGAGGRPSAKYTLKAAEAQKAGTPPPLRFETDTFVVTPADREARVLLHRRDDWVELQYLSGAREKATLRARLLAPFQPGRARPKPVRIT